MMGFPWERLIRMGAVEMDGHEWASVASLGTMHKQKCARCGSIATLIRDDDNRVDISDHSQCAGTDRKSVTGETTFVLDDPVQPFRKEIMNRADLLDFHGVSRSVLEQRIVDLVAALTDLEQRVQSLEQRILGRASMASNNHRAAASNDSIIRLEAYRNTLADLRELLSP